MLSTENLRKLVGELVATAELLGHDISPAAAAMMANDLAVYPVDVLARALKRVRSEHTGKLTPKVILDRIDEAMGRPPANEAWAIASTALDERATIVWTAEMSDAWAIARPVAEAGDMIGARMAFIAAYERLVRTARDERRVPEVTVSLGWDKEAAAPALEKAVQLGYLRQEQAQQYLPAPTTSPVFNPVALLAGKVEVKKGAPDGVRQRLEQLRDELANRTAVDSKRRSEEAERRRRDLAELKAETQARVDARLRAEGGGQ